jgi:hypothetical protein
MVAVKLAVSMVVMVEAVAVGHHLSEPELPDKEIMVDCLVQIMSVILLVAEEEVLARLAVLVRVAVEETVVQDLLVLSQGHQ